jgi:PAS domain S-box-containing protein
MVTFKDLPISGKLMRMNLIISASLLAFSCGAFVVYQLFTFKETALEHMATEADMVAIDITPAMRFNDEVAAKETLRALQAVPDVIGAAVYTTDGVKFASYERDPANRQLATGNMNPSPSTLKIAPNAHRLDANGLIVLRQIAFQGRPIGMVYLMSDLHGLTRRLRAHAVIATSVLAVSLILAMVMSSIMEKRISRPVLALAQTARMIARRQDYSVRAAIHSKDEIGTLGEAFNEMLRQIEEKDATLRESEQNFRELADAMPQIVWTSDRQGNRQYLNRRWFDYTGTAPGDPLSVQVVHADDIGRATDTWRRSVATGTPFAMEYRLRRGSDGAYRWHLGRALPVRDEQGTIVRWFGTVTDIDDHKRVEEEVWRINADLELRVAERTEKLTAANADLARANEAKDRFLASMSHELRTPLNAIIGFTGTLLMKLSGPLTADQETQLQTVRTSARHLLSLINDLLDLAKIQSGKVHLRLEPVNCRGLLNDVTATLRPLAHAKGLRFDVTMPEEELVVVADYRALSQIMINLTNNAIKFTESGFVRVDLKRLETSPDRIELAVSDSGAGISEKDQARLFQAFEQIERTGRLEGTGLGLHLSQQLAALLGGTITVDSETGKGSRFSLALRESA